MGISDCVDALDGDVEVDCSVGTIVWVRRRNGSWWPGRILGPDELSASHLMSPRSGTPVKLLGRDDASVDWYNLEKSKRVKAFRCGEFDACIERAEASHGIPIKKREKYARREDAILHALELEEKQKLGNLSIGISSKTSGAPKRELDNFFSEVYLRNDEPGVHSKFAPHKSQAVSRKAAVSHDEDNISDSLYARKGRSGKQFVWEEDIPEAIPRMRGLQDFGLRIAPSKKKLSPSVAWESSRTPVDYDADILSNAMMGGAAHSGSSRNSLSIKRKRTQGGSTEESLVKKRDKRRPLVQVLQSSVKLPVSHSFPIQGEKDHIGAVCRAKRSRCIYLPADLNNSLDHTGYSSEEITITATQFEMDNRLQRPASLEEECTSSGLIEATESDSSGREFWEAGMEDEANLLTDTTEALLPGSKDCDSSDFQISDKFGNITKDMALSRYIPELHPDEQAEDGSAEGAVSKWHMKGKRNARNLPKRTLDAMDEKVSISSADNCNGFSYGKSYKSKESSFKMGVMEPSIKGTLGRGLYHEKGPNHACERGDSDSKDWGPTQLTGYGNRRHPFPLQAVKDRGRSHIAMNDSGTDSQLISQLGWEADVPSHVVRSARWVGSDECFEPVFDGHISDEMEPMLVDVTLKVQASYQGEHVPLVSLMSRLNGKAIIGHPVQIEIIEGGPAGQLVSRNDAGLDESTATQPVWRTARRTAMQRLPRSNPAASALEGEDAEPLQYSDNESKPPMNRSYSGLSNHHAKLVKKSFPHDRQPVWGKPQKNLLKRVCLSNQKTRTLSSIATEQKPRGDNSGAKLSRGSGILGGMIKPDGAVPLVTCVPVKVVFSRILEAVGRPSAAAAHRVRMTSPAVRYPS